jgi:hypothetical protein
VYCNYWDNQIYTADQMAIQRPTIGRTDPTPFFLGGPVTSGAYTSQSTIVSNGNGATETPSYTITAGGSYGTLSCSTCISPIYTAVAASTCANGNPNYTVTIVASYNGFQSSALFIFNNSPASFATMAVNQEPLTNAWETDYVYKVLDLCGNPMNWVEVNESFTNARHVYPELTSGWPLPGDGVWTLGVWSNNVSNPSSHFDVYGQFTDILFEQDGAGKSPTPLSNGKNGYSESADSTVTTASQWFKAGTISNGYGLLIHSNTHTHYIDHGTAQ